MTVSSWLLSLAGIAAFSVLIDVILPNGQTNKYVKGMFAFVMLLVIIAPLPALLKKDFNVENFFSSSQIEIDHDFVYQANRTKLSFLEKQLTKQLESSGFDGVVVAVNGDIFKTDMQIENVFVDLRNVVIKSENKHIYIKKTVYEIVLNVANISKEKVQLYEWKEKVVWKDFFFSKIKKHQTHWNNHSGYFCNYCFFNLFFFNK